MVILLQHDGRHVMFFIAGIVCLSMCRYLTAIWENWTTCQSTKMKMCSLPPFKSVIMRYVISSMPGTCLSIISCMLPPKVGQYEGEWRQNPVKFSDPSYHHYIRVHPGQNFLIKAEIVGNDIADEARISQFQRITPCGCVNYAAKHPNRLAQSIKVSGEQPSYKTVS